MVVEQNRVTPSPLDFGLWTWTWIVTKSSKTYLNFCPLIPSPGNPPHQILKTLKIHLDLDLLSLLCNEITSVDNVLCSRRPAMFY